MMKRIPEPELMNNPAQALAYATADFSEPNRLFVRLFQKAFPECNPATVLDLGCGPADIAIRFARLFPASLVTGLDGASQMLLCGNAAIAACGLQQRVTLWQRVLPLDSLPQTGYEAIISNSLLHHLTDPLVLWRTIRAAGGPGAAVLVMDLKRPLSRQAAEHIVRRYAGNEPAILREDFGNSLLAAYQPEEVREQLAQAGLPGLQVAEVSDRHLAVSGFLDPGDDDQPEKTKKEAI
jgi:ubiquinone/menaquinone biosynthesis C-methylase UbiE